MISKNSKLIRIIFAFIISLILLIPVEIIKIKIRERTQLKRKTINEIQNSWSKPQVFAGPVIAIKYTEPIIVEGKETIYKNHIFLYPDSLNIISQVEPEIRKKSIYKAIVYNSNIKINGYFNLNSLNSSELSNKKLNFEDVEIIVGVNDIRGINNVTDLILEKKNYKFFPTGENKYNSKNLYNGLLVKTNLERNQKYNFSFNLNLKGSQEISFIPLGKKTNVTIKSKWQDPSFSGSFLPDKRTINKNGFEANWNISYFNTPLPVFEIDKSSITSIETFGVIFLNLIDEYQKTTRVVKYAYLIISLTFIVFILISFLSTVQAKYINFVLTGLSLVIFYSLLLSISEFTGFNWAYWISTVAIILQTYLYSLTFLTKSQSVFFALLMIFLYAYLFVLMLLNIFAMLAGSVALFLGLSIIMYISRKIKWEN